MKIKPSHRFIVLLRAAEYKKSPEAILWLSVIRQAITDLSIARFRREADVFIRCPQFRVVCDYVGLNADFAREIIYQEKPKYGTRHEDHNQSTSTLGTEVA